MNPAVLLSEIFLFFALVVATSVNDVPEAKRFRHGLFNMMSSIPIQDSYEYLVLIESLPLNLLGILSQVHLRNPSELAIAIDHLVHPYFSWNSPKARQELLEIYAKIGEVL